MFERGQPIAKMQDSAAVSGAKMSPLLISNKNIDTSRTGMPKFLEKWRPHRVPCIPAHSSSPPTETSVVRKWKQSLDRLQKRKLNYSPRGFVS